MSCEATPLDVRSVSVSDVCGGSKMAVTAAGGAGGGLHDDKCECKSTCCLFEPVSKTLADETPREQLLADELSG